MMRRTKRVWIGFAIVGLLAGLGSYAYWQQVAIPVNLHFSMVEDGRLEIDLGKSVSGNLKRSFTIENQPVNGWLNGDLPTIVYEPRKDFFGHDRFTFTVTTFFGLPYQGTVSLIVDGRNDPPIAKDIAVSVREDESVRLRLSAADPDGNPVTFDILHEPFHGTISGQPPHLVYQPNPDYFGTDRIIYAARDSETLSQPATIEIGVIPVNDPPIAEPKTVSTYRDFPVSIEPDVSDPDSTDLGLKRVTNPNHGHLNIIKNRFVYRPKKGFTGRDSFTYRVFDGVDYSKSERISVVVQPFKGAEKLTRQLQGVIRRGGVAIGSEKHGVYIFQSGKYQPASILKLATASAALHMLGESAHFQTEFYLDLQRNLYIKGYADPSLTTSEWHRIAKILSSQAVFDLPIKRIVLDDTAVDKGTDFNGRGRSISYFDAPLGALASNYNIAEVNIKSGHRVLSWKNRTPVTEIVRRRAKGLPRGYQRFSVAADPEKGTLYSGELARRIFQEHGLKNRPKIVLGTVPVSLDVLYIHDSSADLKGIVRTMLADSSNFIANQLLLGMAIDRYGEPARLDQGVALLKRYLRREQGLLQSDYVIVEGSGLSRQNRIDLAAMLDILIRFKAHRELLPLLTKSRYSDLIRIGRQWHIIAKTGTMKGVSTLAGFLKQKSGKWLPFVIMLEGDTADRARVLKIICRFYSKADKKA